MTAALEITDLTCCYDDRVAVDNLTFAIETGAFFIVIGPNGSGKSTLLNTVSGLIKPTQGTVKIQNQLLQDYNQKSLARTIALVPQSMEIDFPFTVRDVVLMGRTPHQGLLGLEGARDSEVVEEVLGFTDLKELADRKVYQLSGGERQRVFIARAICQQPQIMLLDEPTAALDLSHQTRIMDLMSRLINEKGLTVVMVSHDINLASIYASQLLLMKSGGLIKLGTPREVLQYEILEQAYDCTLLVDESPIKNSPRITLVPESYLKELK